jgi:hypothetical protein
MITTTSAEHNASIASRTRVYPSYDEALRAGDEWIARHKAHGCHVEWLPLGRIVATHPHLDLAAVLIIAP